LSRGRATRFGDAPIGGSKYLGANVADAITTGVVTTSTVSADPE
jgi:hypothetical protein